MVPLQLYVQHGDFFWTVLPTDVNLPNLFHLQQLYVFTRDNPHHIQPHEISSGTETAIPYQSEQ